jgi:hypothetical protein
VDTHWADTHVVKHALARRVPDREGEIAVQLGGAILTELVIEMENDFGFSDSAEYATPAFKASRSST